MQIKAILLDLDFTLVDASQGIHLCIQHALSSMGYPEPDFATTISTIGLSLPDTFKSITKNDSQEDANQFDKLFVARSKQVLIANTQLLDATLPFIQSATEKGYKLAIVTSKYRDGLDDILNQHDIRQFFTFHIAGDEVIHPKPHPMSLERALAALEVERDESIYVGDSTVDAEAAQRAQVKFVAVLTGQAKKKDLLGYPAHAILNDLTELLDCIH